MMTLHVHGSMTFFAGRFRTLDEFHCFMMKTLNCVKTKPAMQGSGARVSSSLFGRLPVWEVFPSRTSLWMSQDVKIWKVHSGPPGTLQTCIEKFWFEMTHPSANIFLTAVNGFILMYILSIYGFMIYDWLDMLYWSFLYTYTSFLLPSSNEALWMLWVCDVRHFSDITHDLIYRYMIL